MLGKKLAKDQSFKRTFLLSIGFLALLLIFTFLFYRDYKNETNQQLRMALKAQSEREVKLIKQIFKERVLALDRMANRFTLPSDSEYKKWKEDSDHYLENFRGTLAIEWADEDTKVTWINPLKGNEAAINLILNKETNRKEAIERSLRDRRGVYTNPIELKQGGIGILSVHPTYFDKKNNGFIIAVYRLDSLFESILDDHYDYKIKINEKLAYDTSSGNYDSLAASSEFSYANAKFNLELTPKEKIVNNYQSLFQSSNTLILLILFLILNTVTISIISYQYFKSRNQRSEIKNKQEELNYILGSMSLGIWIWYLEDNILHWDESMYKLYGLNEEDFGGHYEAWESSLHPDYKEKASQEVQDALDGKKEFNTTFAITQKNGTKKYIGSRGDVKRDEKGSPLIMYGINWDKTEEVELHEKLDEERLTSIQSSKLATLGEMAAGVAHEINNPLAIISASSLMTKRSLGNDELIVKNQDTILETVERVSKIIRTLMKFTRRTEDEEKKSCKVSVIIDDSLELINAKSKADYVPIEKTDFEDFRVFCDEIQISQILVNLIGNAVDANKDKDNAFIKVQAEKIQNIGKIIVQDSGSGIDSGTLEKIFNPFFTTKDIGVGTGLGLSISKKLAEQNGGDLYYELKDGKTTFVIEVPLEA